MERGMSPRYINLLVNAYGTGKVPDAKIVEIIRKTFPLKPAGIIKYLDLLKPIYSKTSCYGHFGREEPEFTWEKTDKAEILRKEAGYEFSINTQTSFRNPYGQEYQAQKQ